MSSSSPPGPPDVSMQDSPGACASVSTPSSGVPSIGSGDIGLGTPSSGDFCAAGTPSSISTISTISTPSSVASVGYSDGDVAALADVWEGFQMMERHDVTKSNCQSLEDIRERLRLHIQREVGHGKTTGAVSKQPHRKLLLDHSIVYPSDALSYYVFGNFRCLYHNGLSQY